MSNVPDWIGAIGTVATLTTGLVLFAITISDRRRAHAALVAAWTELRTTSELEWKHVSPSGNVIEARIDISKIENSEDFLEPLSFSLLIKNGSTQPAYDCAIHAQLDGKSLPPGAYPVIYGTFSKRLGIIGPETQLPEVSLLVGAPRRGHDLQEALADALKFSFVFTDATGRSWTRDQNGRLRRRRPTAGQDTRDWLDQLNSND